MQMEEKRERGFDRIGTKREKVRVGEIRGRGKRRRRRI